MNPIEAVKAIMQALLGACAVYTSTDGERELSNATQPELLLS